MSNRAIVESRNRELVRNAASLILDKMGGSGFTDPLVDIEQIIEQTAENIECAKCQERHAKETP